MSYGTYGAYGQQIDPQTTVETWTPTVIDVLTDVFKPKGKSLNQLYNQLGRKQVKYATATNPARRAKLASEIEALQAQIDYQESIALEAAGMLKEEEPSQNIWIWIPWALLGVVVVGGGAYLIARRK